MKFINQHLDYSLDDSCYEKKSIFVEFTLEFSFSFLSSGLTFLVEVDHTENAVI